MKTKEATPHTCHDLLPGATAADYIRPFSVLLQPCTVSAGRDCPVYVRIHYSEGAEGRLSITGVEGPRGHGDAWGSSGQCVEALRTGTPANGWTAETLAQLADIWDRWHLNDMRPDCEHQRALGWCDLAGVEVLLYHWRQTTDSRQATAAAEKAAKAALLAGETFTPTPEQISAARMPWSCTTYTPDAPAGYGPPSAGLGVQHVERKTLGWLKPEEHPDGILCRPCPTCGYKYGSRWNFEAVPVEVLAWLQSLPESETPCPWRSF